MKNYILNILLLSTIFVFSQQEQDATKLYKKRVLESTELDILTSYYTQDGNNAAVTGGLGTEKLEDVALDITISIPINEDDIFSFNGTISDYTSASSGNLDPFSGASRPAYDNNDATKEGSPWVDSSGASQTDVWVHANIEYSHYSEDRNLIKTVHLSTAREHDYSSFGFGAGLTKLFNKKNTEITAKVNTYLDKWNPEYPIEIISYKKLNGNLFTGFFSGTPILDNNGNAIDKTNSNAWKPINTSLVKDKKRNTLSVTLSFSQIINKKAQISLFADFVSQNGWLANPMQRVYFKDKSNFYIGEAEDIPFYTDASKNNGVFQLADDIERLPNSRIKFPLGVRFHYYINEKFVFKTYYRFYTDNWGINSHTFNVELPIKITDNFTLYPNYRFYTQTAADYFYKYDEALSTVNFYTSDYDLSKFNANQIGLGIKYTDVFTKRKLWKFGLKNLSLNYSYYNRSTNLQSHIITIGTKFIVE